MVTIVAMSPAKKPDEKPKRPNRSGVPLHIYIPPALDGIISAGAKRRRRKITQEVIVAIEEHYRRLGELPEGYGEEEGD